MSGPYYQDNAVTLHHADCLHVLANMGDNTVDAIVTDPPYGLEFMGKDWDKFRIDDPGTNRHRGQRAAKHAITHDSSAAPRDPDNPWQKERSGYVVGQRAKTYRCDGCGKRDQFRNVHKCPPGTTWLEELVNPHAAPPGALAYQTWCRTWATECLRVLKPGGHMLAFGGDRTAHRLVSAIEDAGFEIRHTIAWIYASGFPKSRDVSKDIDRMNGKHERDLEPFGAYVRTCRRAKGWSLRDLDNAMGTNTAASWWEGRKSGVQPPGLAVYRRLKETLDMDDRFDVLIEWLEAEREVIGTRTDVATRIYDNHEGPRLPDVINVTAPALDDAKRWAGWGTGLKPAHEPITLARKPFTGTVAANVLTYGTGALNINGCRTDGPVLDSERRTSRSAVAGSGAVYNQEGWTRQREAERGERHNPAGRWPPNLILTHAATPQGEDLCVDGCVNGCPVLELDRQSGSTASRSGGLTTKALGLMNDDAWVARDLPRTGHDDSGGASRFFPVFRYQAKAPASERPQDWDGTGHPTVKPLDLIRWLARLITPPHGLILDPFAGSGTLGEAAVIEGFRAILVEQDEASCRRTVRRLSKPIQPVLDLGEGVP